MGRLHKILGYPSKMNAINAIKCCAIWAKMVYRKANRCYVVYGVYQRSNVEQIPK